MILFQTPTPDDYFGRVALQFEGCHIKQSSTDKSGLESVYFNLNTKDVPGYIQVRLHPSPGGSEWESFRRGSQIWLPIEPTNKYQVNQQFTIGEESFQVTSSDATYSESLTTVRFGHYTLQSVISTLSGVPKSQLDVYKQISERFAREGLNYVVVNDPKEPIRLTTDPKYTDLSKLAGEPFGPTPYGITKFFPGKHKLYAPLASMFVVVDGKRIEFKGLVLREGKHIFIPTETVKDVQAAIR